MDPATITHAFAVFALFGLIWTIQLVHYPMFKFVEAPHWPHFHRIHSRNITFIVFPLMLVELLTSLKLYLENDAFSNLLALVCAATVWLVTIIIFIPLHNKVATRPLPSALAHLCHFNWIRTVVWTIAAANAFTKMLPS